MYQNIKKNLSKLDLQIPPTIVPIPTIEDYEIGFIYRYFVRKANDENAFIYEVSEDIFGEYSEKKLWVSYRMKWRISGPQTVVYKEDGSIDDKGVIQSNKSAIGFANSLLKNISLYLPNLLQFYKG